LNVSDVCGGLVMKGVFEHRAWAHGADEAVGEKAGDEQAYCRESADREAREPFHNAPLLHPREDEQADGSGPYNGEHAGDEEPDDQDDAGTHVSVRGLY